METETPTPRPAVVLRRSTFPGRFVLERDGQRAFLSREDLQAIAQAAYDLEGLLATPSYDVEAALAVVAPQPAECCASGRCEVCTPGYRW